MGKTGRDGTLTWRRRHVQDERTRLEAEMERSKPGARWGSLGEIRGIAFDLDGTIWAGPTLLPGACELVSELRASGLPVVFASNSSRHGSALLAQRLTSMGIAA